MTTFLSNCEDLPTVNPLSDAEIEAAWDERAAIHEHEGRLSRQFSETKAAMSIRRQFGRVPAVVIERMRAVENR